MTSPQFEQPPFVVSRCPAGFSFGEICAAPKQQPIADVDTAAAILRGRRGSSTLLKAETVFIPSVAAAASATVTASAADGSSSDNHNTGNAISGDGEVVLSAPPPPPPSISYHVLHTGNFVRVATMPGRLYWVAQNATTHTTPDWKLHIACDPTEVAIVWNLCVLPVFLETPCLATVGMKAILSAERDAKTGEFVTSPGDRWPPEQLGREVTVYLYVDAPQNTYRDLFGNAKKDAAPEQQQQQQAEAGATSNGDDDDGLQQQPITSIQQQQLWRGDHPNLIDHWHSLLNVATTYSANDLIRFVKKVQQRLDFYQIRTRGCAEGDLPLTRCVSLRNEAYTSGVAFAQNNVLFADQKQEKADQREQTVAAGAGGNEATMMSLSKAAAASSAGGGGGGGCMCTANEEEDTFRLLRLHDTTLLYPLNVWGWNAAAHEVPVAIQQMVDYFSSAASPINNTDGGTTATTTTFSCGAAEEGMKVEEQANATVVGGAPQQVSLCTC